MQFASPLICGTLVRRYKRFLADVVLEDGSVVTAHCPNTGAMTGCAEPGWKVWLRPANDPSRKLDYTWELSVDDQHHIIGVNTGNANNIVAEALGRGIVTEVKGYKSFRREVSFGNERSKVDFLLSDGAHAKMYLEVKSVTLLQNGCGLFPDTETARGQKHLRELMSIQSSGKANAAVLFCVQHSGIHKVATANDIDPEYARLMRMALKMGVKVFAYGCRLNENEITMVEPLPFMFEH